jgi:hypothetical protein
MIWYILWTLWWTAGLSEARNSCACPVNILCICGAVSVYSQVWILWQLLIIHLFWFIRHTARVGPGTCLFTVCPPPPLLHVCLLRQNFALEMRFVCKLRGSSANLTGPVLSAHVRKTERNGGDSYAVSTEEVTYFCTKHRHVLLETGRHGLDGLRWWRVSSCSCEG